MINPNQSAPGNGFQTVNAGHDLQITVSEGRSLSSLQRIEAMFRHCTDCGDRLERKNTNVCDACLEKAILGSKEKQK